jgi:hypothetical protein
MIATVGTAPADHRRNGHRERVEQPAEVVATPTRARRSTTALSLRLGMALACLPVAFFAATVQLGTARNDATVRTVAHDATRGITVAQNIKLNLAQLDAIVVEDLLDHAPLGANGFPADYDHKRSELDDNLVLAASSAPEGAAYRQPLSNIDYALAHYHTLAKEAFATGASGDVATASDRYGRAHDVMQGTLLSAADFVDKANTYVLNNAYDTQKDRSASTVRLIVVSWGLLVLFLVVAQLLVARKFRRLVNLPLVAATVLALVGGGFALSRLSTSADQLSSARERAFDSVHVLARAGATVVAAHQAEGQLLLDPGDKAEAMAAQEAFDTQAHRLFRVQGRQDVADLAKAGAVPDGAGGYLAKVAAADRPDGDDGAVAGADDEQATRGTTRRALVAFGDFLTADQLLRQAVVSGDVAAGNGMYHNAVAFDGLSRAIGDAQTVDQATFDRHARAATRATNHLDRIALVAAAGILLLALLGLYQRLREYGT